MQLTLLRGDQAITEKTSYRGIMDDHDEHHCFTIIYENLVYTA